MDPGSPPPFILGLFRTSLVSFWDFPLLLRLSQRNLSKPFWQYGNQSFYLFYLRDSGVVKSSMIFLQNSVYACSLTKTQHIFPIVDILQYYLTRCLPKYLNNIRTLFFRTSWTQGWSWSPRRKGQHRIIWLPHAHGLGKTTMTSLMNVSP